MKYIKVNWPEIQDYMHHPDYNKEVSYDARNNCWFVPEEWKDEFYEDPYGIGDLEDAMG